jgi:leucyl/phenylalanyl-tRNA--protein transferase
MRNPTLPELADFFLMMYSQGYFPMANEPDGQLEWYYPRDRAIIQLNDHFHVSRSLRKTIRRHPFTIKIDTATDRVIAECASRDESWINGEYKAVFGELARRNIVHSVEAWDGDQLVGGLYGLALGAAFIGESMFSRVSDASKVCLVHLVHRLRHRGIRLLDSQIINPHIEQFGTFEVPHAAYLLHLRRMLQLPRRFDGDIPTFDLDQFLNSSTDA